MPNTTSGYKCTRSSGQQRWVQPVVPICVKNEDVCESAFFPKKLSELARAY